MGTIAQQFESGAQSADKGIFKNLVMLARVDGTVDESEKNLLNRIAKRLSLTEEQVAEIRTNPGNYPMVPPSSKEDRIERFVQFIEMICIDGVVDTKEEKLANKYGITLGYNSEQVAELETTIIEHFKSGKAPEDIVSLLM
ncbi:MAG: hypothetical protein HRT57_00710 [Crocinitomicaceae bacterium]|nr:hypothetical protein [Crocinitomicaceae bacterium]